MSSQRQIPQAKEYLCNPLYWDIVYGYIQVNSEWDGIEGHPRILPKRKAVFSKIGEYLGLSRQTVSKHFQDLGEGSTKNGTGLNLIRKLPNGDYEIEILDSKIATLINIDTLRVLTSAVNEHTISVYVYLYSRWKASKGSFSFTYEQLKKVIGIGSDSSSNNYIIKDILNVLALMQLLNFEVDTDVLAESGGYRTMFRVTGMKDTVTDIIAEKIEQRRKEKC